MADVPGYEGKRVIVTGAARGIGAATTALLVELGAEVHTIDVEKPVMTGLASYSECDVRDREQVDVTIERIGAYVHALFNCAPVGPDATRYLIDAVVPKMLPGSTIVSVVESGADPLVIEIADIRSYSVRVDVNDADAAARLLINEAL